MKKWEWIDLTKVSLIVLFWITLFFTATFLIDTTVEEDVNNLDERISEVEETYYTQKEVDLLIREIEDSFDAQAMNNLNERVLELESELRDFDKFEYEDLIEFEEYFYGTWVNDLETYFDIDEDGKMIIVEEEE